jgi:hypothetical protein
LNRPVICLTPVKNEAWILETFLQCASLWADHIVVADQGSTDDSVDICGRFPKVRVVTNDTSDYSEQYRQKLLLRAARSISPDAILIALDADEFLSANSLQSQEWTTLKELPGGTSIEFPRIDVDPGAMTYFYHTVEDGNMAFDCGYVDDGASHRGTEIHSTRVPHPPGAPVFRCQECIVLHYQFVSPNRVDSKHRWYMCFERIKYPEKTADDIVRMYTWMKNKTWNRRSLEPRWLAGYQEMEINVTNFDDSGPFWWDWEVLRMFRAYETKKFKALDIWDVDWEQIRQIGLSRGMEGLPETRIKPPKAPGSPLIKIVRLARSLVRRLAF